MDIAVPGAATMGVIGVDIGGTKIAGALGDAAGGIVRGARCRHGRGTMGRVGWMRYSQ